MERRGTHTQRIRVLFWVVVGSVLVSVALGGYWFEQVVSQIGLQARQDTLAILELEYAVSDASMELADQTQEWKDSLLRAHDPALLAKHLQAFRVHAEAMKRELRRAKTAAQNLGIDITNIALLERQHQELLEAYEAALGSLDSGDPLSFRSVDAQVLGKDRQLREELRRFKSSLETGIVSKVDALGMADKGVAGQQRFYLTGLLGVFLPLVALAAFFAAFRALREIGRNDARIRAIHQSIGDAVVVTNSQGQVESLNGRAQQLMGWSQNEAHGKPLAEVFQIYDANNQWRVESPVEIVLRDGRPIPMSNGMLLRRRDGSEVAIEDSAAPVFGEDGKMFGVVMVFHDVSKRYAMLRELRRERELYRQTFERAAVGIAHLSPAGEWLRVNQTLCEIVGYSEAELLKLTFQDITHPDDLGRDVAQVQAMLDGAIATYKMEKRYFRKGGEIVWINLTVSLARKADGAPDYFISVVENIQARKDAEIAAEAARDQYQALFEQMPEGVLLVDENVQVIAHNREAMRQLEYSSEELLKLHVWDFEAVDDPEAIERRKLKIQQTGRDDFESRYRTRSGRLLDVDVSVQLVRLSDGRQVFQALFHDITEQKQAALQIEHLAYHDQLTGLANRRLLQDRMMQAISSAVRRDAHIAVLYLDLDYFKDVNDSLGHQVGDILLQFVARRLQKCIRAEDTLARVGGDEFVIMLNDISSSGDAAAIAEKVLREVAQPLQIGDDDLRITPSIGISICPQDGRDAQDLLKYADAALYQSKQSGRATYRFYTEELHEKTMERLKIERLLHKAIEKNEFELHYQPQIDLRSGKIVGCEALLRWNHPGIEKMSPARFIPIAEHSNLIIQIGDWVMRQACIQAREWQDLGLNLKVSFNVSPRQFMRPVEFVRSMSSAIRDSGVNPALLGIELTENLLLDPQGMGEVLSEIRALGIHLALDDFGTGYSSLSYLRRFPINTLKIDRSFVSNADRDENDAEMVKTIIGMAHNLGMSLVAEGVETAEQGALLSTLGCEVAQGYHFSHPLPVAEFVTFLRQDR